MFILANPLIGKTLSYSNLKLNDKGLYYVVKNDTEKMFVFLTSDYKVICDMIEMDHSIAEELDNQNNFFDFVCESKFFKPRRLHGEAIDHLREVKMIVAFEAYLNEIGIENVEKMRSSHNIIFTTITYDQLKERFPHLDEDVKRIQYWFANSKKIAADSKKNFNGGKIIAAYPNIHKPNLEIIFEKVNSNFINAMDRHLFLSETKFETIIEQLVPQDLLA